MFKKFTSLILALLTAAVCLSCGETPSDDTNEAETSPDINTDTEAEQKSPLELLGDKDFGGAVYTILDGNDYQGTYQNLPVDGLNGDIINDALYNRGKYIEDNYNVKIEYKVMTKNEASSQTQNSVMSGEKNCDLLISSISGGLDVLATSNILANLTDYDELSLYSPWWSSLMNEQLSLDDRIYMTSGDINLTIYSTPSCVFLNSKLLEDYDLNQDYYSIVSDGKWTWDVMKSITADYNQDLNNDGQMTAADDFFGLLHLKNEIAACAMITGSGIHLSTIENQMIKLDLANERLFSVMDKLNSLLHPVSFKEQSDCLYTFMEDRAIALIHTAGTGKNWFRDMNSDYMILPIPKYDETQKTYYSYANTWTPAYIGIPLTATDESTGFITEALARYSYEKIRPEFYNLILKQKGARDERSGDMLDIIFESVYLDFNSVYNFGGTRALLKSVLFEGTELASSLASAQTAADTAIEQFVKSWTKEK